MQIALSNPGAYGALIRSMQPLVGELSPAALAIAQNGIQAQAVLDRIAPDLDMAADLAVDSPDMLEEAQAIMGRLAAVAADRTGALDAERLALTEPFRLLVQRINDGYAGAMGHVRSVKESLSARVLHYNAEQQRKAEEAARLEREQREAEARRLAEKEKAWQAQAQALLHQAYEAAGQGALVAADVLTAEAAQRSDEARAVAQQASQVMHTRTVSSFTKAKGVRENWSAEVTDAEAFILFVADKLKAGDKTWLPYVIVNAQAMNAKARTEKENFLVPGVRALRSESLATRRAAL